MNNIGKFGEDEALKFLKKKKYEFVDRNVHSRFGEIDLIVKNKKYIVFVEVKSQKQNPFVSGGEKINSAKMHKFKNTVLLYLQQNETELQPRIDVVEAYFDDNMKFEFNHIENAF